MQTVCNEQPEKRSRATREQAYFMSSICRARLMERLSWRW